MKKNRISARLFVLIALPVIMMFVSLQVFAQQPPPRPIHVTLVQNMAFGAFYQGATGGTVTINTNSTRVATGDITLLNMAGYTFNAASFRVSGNKGTVISIMLGGDVTLPGSNGGSMKLNLVGTDPASPFVLTTNPSTYTTVYFSGTLTVGNSSSSPPGNYSGTFDLTFIQE